MANDEQLRRQLAQREMAQREMAQRANARTAQQAPATRRARQQPVVPSAQPPKVPLVQQPTHPPMQGVCRSPESPLPIADLIMPGDPRSVMPHERMGLSNERTLFPSIMGNHALGLYPALQVGSTNMFAWGSPVLPGEWLRLLKALKDLDADDFETRQEAEGILLTWVVPGSWVPCDYKAADLETAIGRTTRAIKILNEALKSATSQTVHSYLLNLIEDVRWFRVGLLAKDHFFNGNFPGSGSDELRDLEKYARANLKAMSASMDAAQAHYEELGVRLIGLENSLEASEDPLEIADKIGEIGRLKSEVAAAKEAWESAKSTYFTMSGPYRGVIEKLPVE